MQANRQGVNPINRGGALPTRALIWENGACTVSVRTRREPMMPDTGTWLSVMLVATLLVVGCDSDSSTPPDANQVAQVEPMERWAGEAFGLLEKLAAVAERLPEIEPVSWEEIIESGSVEWLSAETRANREKGDRILWKLWLTTGKVPLENDEPEETARSLFERNHDEYRQYVEANKARPAEDIHTQGLNNAIEAIRTPLWESALLYLQHKTGLPFDRMQEPFPSSGCIVLGSWLTPKGGREQRRAERIAAAVRVWLNAKTDQLVWNEQSRAFIVEIEDCQDTDILLTEVYEAMVAEMSVRSDPAGNEGSGR